MVNVLVERFRGLLASVVIPLNIGRISSDKARNSLAKVGNPLAKVGNPLAKVGNSLAKASILTNKSTTQWHWLTLHGLIPVLYRNLPS